jgi:hypothetical protein
MDIVAEAETKLALQHLPRLVLVGVAVKRRALSGRDHILEGGEATGGLFAAGLEGERSTNGTSNRRALAWTDVDGRGTFLDLVSVHRLRP